MNLAQGMAWLGAKVLEREGVTVTYSRGETALEITAAPGRTRWESTDADGGIVRMDSLDWFVAAADLGVLGEPAAGDRVSYGDSVYEVMSLDGEAPWQWADAPNRGVYRIHTKEVERT